MVEPIFPTNATNIFFFYLTIKVPIPSVGVKCQNNVAQRFFFTISIQCVSEVVDKHCFYSENV